MKGSSYLLMLLGCLAVDNFVVAKQNDNTLAPEASRKTRNTNRLDYQSLQGQRNPSNIGYQQVLQQSYNNGQGQRLSQRQQGSSQWTGTGQQSSNQVSPLRPSANRLRPVNVSAPQNQYLVGSEQRLAPVTAPLIQPATAPRQRGPSQWAGIGQHSSNQVSPLQPSANHLQPVRVPAPQNQYLVGSEQRLTPVTARPVTAFLIQPAPAPRQQGSSQWAGIGQHSSNQVSPLQPSANHLQPVRVPAPQNQYLVGSEQRLAPVTAPLIQPAPLLPVLPPQQLIQGVNTVTSSQGGGLVGGGLVGGGLVGGSVLQQGVAQQGVVQQGVAGQGVVQQGLAGQGVAQQGVSGQGQFAASQQQLGASGGYGVGLGGYGNAFYIVENTMDGPYWDGSYYYRYETSDGTYREEGGVPNGQCFGAMLSIRGSFSHVTPGGVVVHHEYMSDKNGYSAFPAGSRPDVFTPPERQPVPPPLPEGGIQPCTPEDLA